MRPRNTDRDAARACGDVHFEGKPCRACGGTLRYTRNYTCVACNVSHRLMHSEDTKKPETPAATLEEARRTKAKFYFGKDCARHPGAYRYRINGHCVQCKKMADKGESMIAPAQEIEIDAPTYAGPPCAQGHTIRYVSTRRCVECHRQECKDRREIIGSDYNICATQKRREERDMRKRLAMIRAERTAKQKACAYGVPI